MMKRILLLCTIGMTMLGSARAQSWLTAVSVQGTHGLKYRTTLGLFHRTGDRLRGTIRWSANLQGEYRPNRALSLFGGYTLLYNHLHADDDSRYWQLRHRLFAAVMPRWSWDTFSFNFRQMYQIVQWRDLNHRHQHTQRLRSRIYTEFATDQVAIRPYAYHELFFDARDRFRLREHQLTVGASYYVTSSNKISLQYRRIFRLDGKYPPEGLDMIGISYMFLFKI